MFSFLKPKKKLYISKNDGLRREDYYELVTADEEIIDFINTYIMKVIDEFPELNTTRSIFGKEVHLPHGSFTTDPVRTSYIYVETRGQQYEFTGMCIEKMFFTFDMVGMLRKNDYRVIFEDCKEPKPILGMSVIFDAYLNGHMNKETFLETYWTMSGIDITEDMKKFIDRTRFTPEQRKLMTSIRDGLEAFKSLQIGKQDPTAERMLAMSNEILRRGK